jgi:hypothetical protein
MRNEVVVLPIIGLTYLMSDFSLSKGWVALLAGVLHSSSRTSGSISLQQNPIGPSGFPASRAVFVENIWFGSTEPEP